MNAKEALDRLKRGNSVYLSAEGNFAPISPDIRKETAEHGQHPYAIVIACSDSRVIPEDIFYCGIGEIFTIRVAGNVVNDSEIASVEYAAEHLHVELAVVLGHTNCGAIGAAIKGETNGHVGSITRIIQKAIDNEADPCKASMINARCQAAKLKSLMPTLKVVSALYHIDTGMVEWLEE